MTVQQAFDEKVRSDMLYYENLLRQAVGNGEVALSENIKIILSVLYFEITKNGKNNNIKKGKEQEKNKSIQLH